MMASSGSSDKLSEAEHRSLLRLAGSGGGGGGGGERRTDFDVLREHFRFAWREGEEDESSWGARMAKQYVAKLFKEYALADLNRYKQGQVGLRWRVQREVIEGKGQFICGNLACDCRERLASYELNFRYVEGGEAKHELVKVRVCERCKVLLDKARGGGGRAGGAVAPTKEGQRREEKERRERSPPPSPPPSERKRAKEDGAVTEKGRAAAAGGVAQPPPVPPARPPSAARVEADAVAARRDEAMQKERERRGREMDAMVLSILEGGAGGEKPPTTATESKS